MRRRDFVKTCGAAGLMASASVPLFFPPDKIHALGKFARVPLRNAEGASLRVGSIRPNTNYLFFYPYRSTPCFLLNLDRRIEPASVPLVGESAYDWAGGVGPGNNIVAFTAICSHNQTHPTPLISHINYDHKLGTIHCCVHRSEFDPAAGGKRLNGAAVQPLAAILLEWDQAKDELWATGVLGPETFMLFFMQFKRDLRARFGSSLEAKKEITEIRVQTLKSYSAVLVSCPREPV